jgi:hypothetical protein
LDPTEIRIRGPRRRDETIGVLIHGRLRALEPVKAKQNRFIDSTIFQV